MTDWLLFMLAGLAILEVPNLFAFLIHYSSHPELPWNWRVALGPFVYYRWYDQQVARGD